MNMKKILLSLAFLVVISSNQYINAQQDGFFSSDRNAFEYRNSEENLPLLPRIGTDYNQSATTPIGSGLLILAGLGIGYLTIRKKD